MPSEQKPQRAAKSFLSIRINAEHKAMVVQAAEREGLQLSSFIIMLLVRFHILPESCLKKIKRRPVPFFNALHGLLGVVNKIGGNCKQLAEALPDHGGLHQAHAQIIQAAASLTDALQGKQLPETVNLYRLQGDITQQGYIFNQIVKSVNSGNFNLAGLPAVLHAIARSAEAITSALNGSPVATIEANTGQAPDDMLAKMRQAATELTKRQAGVS